jgi:MFS family permease
MADDLLVVSRGGQLADLWERPAWRVTAYLVLVAALGAIGGLLWSALTPLSSYTVREELNAAITERGQAQIVAGDVVFALLAALIGLVVGVVGWAILHRRGWLVTFVPVLAAAAAALVMWRVGTMVGQTGFSVRLAAAEPGDTVPIDLQLRSMAALLVAPFAAVTPIMLLAAFWPEPRREQPRPPSVVAH